MRRATCARCSTSLARHALVRVALAAAKLDGSPISVLDAPDPHGNATELVCRSRAQCRRRARRRA